jgi:hypothetical protein
METISVALDFHGEEKQRAGTAHRQIEWGGVLANFILSLVAITIILSVALFFASMHTGGGS